MTRSVPRTAVAMVPLVLAAASMIARPAPAADVADDREAQRFFEEPGPADPRRALPALPRRGAAEERPPARLAGPLPCSAATAGRPSCPGRPDESLLVEAVRYEGLEMPPDGPLAEEEVEALVRWVELGAPWPGSGDADAAVRHEPGTLLRRGSGLLGLPAGRAARAAGGRRSRLVPQPDRPLHRSIGSTTPASRPPRRPIAGP